METTGALTPAHTRTDETFRSAGVTCAAWVYRPAGSPDDGVLRPVVVMAHGFSGTRHIRLPAFAERFADAGYVVVLFDYRTFGDSDGGPRQLLSIRGQHADYRAAVAFARRLPGVDPARVVLWGTSLSGGHVLALGAREPGVAAVVAQVPHTSGPSSALAVGAGWAVVNGLKAFADLVRAALGREPLYVQAIGHPHEKALMRTPDAGRGFDAMLAASPDCRADLLADGLTRAVAARVVLAMPLYSPGRHAPRVPVPALVQVARRDVTTPPGPSRRAAARLPHGTLKEYDCAHFDPYTGAAFEQVVGDQLAFLRSAVPVPDRAGR